jgi:hypothetical protein
MVKKESERPIGGKIRDLNYAAISLEALDNDWYGGNKKVELKKADLRDLMKLDFYVDLAIAIGMVLIVLMVFAFGGLTTFFGG